jgi:hypothetical protein
MLAPLRRRRAALIVLAVAVPLALAYSMLEPLVVHDRHDWLATPYNDPWAAWKSSGLLTCGGGYPHIFRFDYQLETVPGWLVL